MENRTLKLNEDEQNMVYRLRRKENTWRSWGKWVIMIYGIIELIWGFVRVVDEGRNMRVTTVLLMFLGILFIAIAARDWQGNVTRTLLIKIIDSSVEKS